jgi:uncharacterized Tic20 family protein
MAALAHATAILPLTGVLAPIVIWVTQKDKSEYVAFQALQAIAYQIIMILAWFGGMALYMGSFVGMFLSMPSASSSRDVPAFVFVPFGVMGLLMICMLAFIVYGLVAAVMALQGKNFRYIVIGSLLKRTLQQK